MSRRLLNKQTQGLFVTIGNADDGYVGKMLPGDQKYDPTKAGQLAPSLLIQDDEVSPMVEALVAKGVIGNESGTATPLQVTNLVVTADLANKIRLTWTNPNDSTIRAIKIIRKAGSNPTNATDGTEIVTYLAENIVPGQVMTYDDVPPTAEPDLYGYAIFTYNAHGLVNAAVTDPGNAGTGAMPTAPGIVTAASATGLTDRVTIAWTNPADTDLAEVRIFKKLGGKTTINSSGASTNGGTQLTTFVDPDSHTDPSASVSYDDMAAVDNQEAHYTIFTKDADDLWNTVGVDVIGTRDAAPGNVSNFAASNDVAGAINLSWTNPSSLDLALVRVFRSLGVTVPAIDSNGATTNGATQVYNAAATPGATVSIADGSSPVTGQTYTYRAFTKDAAGHWNTVGAGDAGERFDAPPVIANLTASSPGAGALNLAWTNPTYPNLATVRIIAKLGSAPANYDDISGNTVVTDTDGSSGFDHNSAAAQTKNFTSLPAGTYHVVVFSSGANGLKQNTVTLNSNYKTQVVS